MPTETSQLLLLLNWMSPTFPIGAFAYSHGMEQAIADERLKTAEDVNSWLSDLITQGSGWNDAVLFARCWQDDVAELNELALALSSSAERYNESTHLGRNFGIAADVWLNTGKPEGEMAYSVAAGRACAKAGIDQTQALIAFLQGFCAAQVSVAVRLIPLGQTRGLEVLRDLAPLIAETATRAQSAALDDIGGACIGADIAAMKHETLEPRIFRT
ncbi:urease accessory protein UreF [Aestuariivirga litoralis]|uniref:urease accessory protein UreF n=1 Tax=Aestuariivirga litoralis TaxID=2650924 RepID=UPI0018C5C021|nr:urease accessory UreF family protein [Aestuariivirga litoralis]